MAKQQQPRKVSSSVTALFQVCFFLTVLAFSYKFYIEYTKPDLYTILTIGDVRLSVHDQHAVEIRAESRHAYTLVIDGEQLLLNLTPRNVDGLDIYQGYVLGSSEKYILIGPNDVQYDWLGSPKNYQEQAVGYQVVPFGQYAPNDYKDLARAVVGAKDEKGENDLADILAEERGYRRVNGVDVSQLVTASNGIELSAEAAANFLLFEQAVEKETGLDLFLTSGYRSEADQQILFASQVSQVCRSEGLTCDINSAPEYVLDRAMERVAPEGYSRHHSGRVVDVVEGVGGSLERFSETTTFNAISENNYRLARDYGFIPSYPEGATDQGPLPEAWEYVYVGTELSL